MMSASAVVAASGDTGAGHPLAHGRPRTPPQACSQAGPAGIGRGASCRVTAAASQDQRDEGQREAVPGPVVAEQPAQIVEDGKRRKGRDLRCDRPGGGREYREQACLHRGAADGQRDESAMPQESLRWHAAPGSYGPLPLRFHLVRCNRTDATGIPHSALRRWINFVPDARYETRRTIAQHGTTPRQPPAAEQAPRAEEPATVLPALRRMIRRYSRSPGG